MAEWKIIEGDCRERLRELPDESVQCCVTSPPYFGLRDYGVDGQLGLEPTVSEYVASFVETFREVWRVLRGDGTLWLNLGDTYAAQRGYQVPDSKYLRMRQNRGGLGIPDGLKSKDLIGIPWRVAFALQADGWYLRSDIIWHKPNPMPESVTDRPTKAHEYLFLLAKGPRYYYDADTIREEHVRLWDEATNGRGLYAAKGRVNKDNDLPVNPHPAGANKRSVWTVTTQPYAEAHFATFPPKLIEPCILAGSRPDDTILDPFAGAGTAGLVALRHDRSFIGIELNPGYCELARNRIRDDAPLLNNHSEQVA